MASEMPFSIGIEDQSITRRGFASVIARAFALAVGVPKIDSMGQPRGNSAAHDSLVTLFMNNIGLTWEGFEDVIFRAGRVYYANESRAKREERLKKAYSSAYNDFIVRLKCA